MLGSLALTSCEDPDDRGSMVAVAGEPGASNSDGCRKEAQAGVRCFPVKGLAVDINAASWAHYQARQP